MNTQVVARDRTLLSSKFTIPTISGDDGNNTEDGKVKNRLLSIWNNVKFGKK